jgi:hypothetical protein
VCIFELHVTVNNTKNIWGKNALGLGILSIAVVSTLFSALAAAYGGAGWLI